MRLAARWCDPCSLDGRSWSGDWEPTTAVLSGGVAEVVVLGQSGHPLVFVPGLAGGWRLLAPLARRLARTHRVYLYDYPDSGPIARRRSSLAEHARDLADLIQDWRLERPTVFGVSFGGAVALELATEAPGLLGGLILSGAAGRYEGGLGYRVVTRVLERFLLPDDSPFLNQFFHVLHGGRPQSAALAQFVVRECWRTDQAAMLARLWALDGFDLTERLWRCDVPTLVLAGTRDVVVPPAQQRALSTALPDARFELIAGAGHIGFLTHGDEVARMVQGSPLGRQRSAHSS